jgi:hypothetical protein
MRDREKPMKNAERSRGDTRRFGGNRGR